MLSGPGIDKESCADYLCAKVTGKVKNKKVKSKKRPQALQTMLQNVTFMLSTPYLSHLFFLIFTFNIILSTE